MSKGAEIKSLCIKRAIVNGCNFETIKFMIENNSEQLKMEHVEYLIKKKQNL